MKLLLATMSLGLCVLAPFPGHRSVAHSTQVAAADDETCAALPEWFPIVSATSAQRAFNTEPKQECEFYQDAYANFLFAVQNDPVSGVPRFFSYKTYSQVFGQPPTLSTPAEKINRSTGNVAMFALTPRLIKRGIGSDDFDSVQQAGFNNILIDQAGNPIYYAMHFNDTFAKFITSAGLLDKNKLASVDPTSTFPTGSIEFKSAWRLKPAAQSDADFAAEYITTQALVPTIVIVPSPRPNGLPSYQVDFANAAPQTVGLIGLHVVFVAVNHPEFVWATFEHLKNAPEGQRAPPIQKDPTRQAPSDPTSSAPVDTAIKDWALYATGTPYSKSNPNPASVRPTLNPDGTLSPAPSVYRLFPGDDLQVVDLDKNVAAGLGSTLYSHYKLVGAVWINKPVDFAVGKDFQDVQFQDPDNDFFGGEKQLSSTSMESFTQNQDRNCFSCHNTMAEQSSNPRKMPASKLAVSHALIRYLDSPDLATIQSLRQSATQTLSHRLPTAHPQ